ncbi:MAG TPA: hypothetical protein DFR83_22035 [Deltaproteobacteria bacterium]|nr:hypothetical protein [Deltaproteobacteria bacterium]
MSSTGRYSVSAIVICTACAGHDHTFQKLVEPNPPQYELSTLRVDLAIQENDYGANITRCQMQVAFEPLPEYTDPDSVNGSDDAESGTTDDTEPVEHVGLPVAPGECVFSVVSPPGPPPEGHGDHSEHPNDDHPPDNDALEGDNWQLSGNVVGPTFVEMWRADASWTLDAVDTEHGGLRYEWTECAVEDYPFSSTLTMDVPASDDPDGVDPFTMDDLVPVGPRVVLDAPMGEHGGQPDIHVEQPLSIAWHNDGGLPEVNGEARSPSTLVKLQTHDHQRQEDVRWLVCWPETEGTLLLSPETLAPLFEGRRDPELYKASLDVHMELLVEDRPTPWGEALTVRTNASTGTGMRIDDGDDHHEQHPEDAPD